MAHRDPVAENPYRILALPGEASWREIERSADKLRAMDSWGAWSSPWDLPLLGPVRRDTTDIDAAFARLADVRHRLADRLLWFHERDAEGAVAYLTPASIRDALEGWAGSSLAVARHDASVVGLVAALTFDPDVEDLPLWRRVLREWKEAMEGDDYWIEVLRVEMEAGFLNPATLGDLREAREGALSTLATVMLDRAREGDHLAAARALAILQDELPPSIYDRIAGRPAQRPLAPPAPPPRPTYHDDESAPDGEHGDEPLHDGEPLRELPTPPPAAPAPERPVWTSAGPDPRDRPPAEPPGPEPADAKPAEPAAARRGPIAMRAHLARLRKGGAPGEPAGPAPEPEPAEAKPEPAAPAAEDLFFAPPPVLAPRARVAWAAAAAEPEAATESPPPGGTEDTPPPAGAIAPAPATATAPAPAAPARRARTRRRLLATLTVAAGVATLALVAPWERTGGPRSPVAATDAGDPLRATLLARVDAADQAIASVLLERAENRREQEFLRGTIDDYRALLADYDWRIAQGLPYDPTGYARVRGYLENDLAEYQAAAQTARALSDHYDALLRERGRLVAQYNQRVR